MLIELFIEQRGLKTVTLKSTRYEKHHITMCLAAKAGSSIKTLPVIILVRNILKWSCCS